MAGRAPPALGVEPSPDNTSAPERRRSPTLGAESGPPHRDTFQFTTFTAVRHRDSGIGKDGTEKCRM